MFGGLAHYGSELLSSLTSLHNTGWHAIPTSFSVFIFQLQLELSLRIPFSSVTTTPKFEMALTV